MGKSPALGFIYQDECIDEMIVSEVIHNKLMWWKSVDGYIIEDDGQQLMDFYLNFIFIVITHITHH